MIDTLAHKAKLSVIWNTGFNLFRDTLQFGVMLVLVRLLDPEAYGQFGMANSVIGFISVFAFHNFIAHTIQVRNEEDVHYQDQFTAGAFIQIGLFFLTNIVAVMLLFVDSYAAIAPLVHLLSLTFLLEWPCELRRKMLERALDWKRLRLLHGVGLLASSILAVGMGFMGAGVYALIAPGLLVTAPFIYELFFTQHWRPNWHLDRVRFAPAFRFGLARLGSGLTAKMRPLLENGLIVQMLGYASAGFLGRAMGLSTMFCQRLALQLMYAIYPVLTKVEPGTDRYQRMSGLILRLVAWVALPTAVIFAALAQPVVLTVYGDKWLEVIPLLPWAMFAGALAALFHTTYMLLLAHHGQKFCLQLDVAVLMATLAALYFGLPYGLTLYLQCLVLIQLVASFVLFWGLCRAGGASWSGLGMALFPPAVGSIAAFVSCKMLFHAAKIDASAFFAALCYGIQFMIIYCLVIRLLFLRPLNELIEYLPGKNMIRSVFFVREVS
jgi:PST family polysaccharide transporter